MDVVPFPDPLVSYPTPHPHITIDPVRTAHIPSLSRITGLLLPIRYSSSFYTACITDSVIASLSRVAVYHDPPISGKSSISASGQRDDQPMTPLVKNGGGGGGGTEKVIGGIRCRLERYSSDACSSDRTESSRSSPTNLYIQTLHLLSPHRGNGVAASLLNSLLFSKTPSPSATDYRVSSLVKHYNIRTVTAHVHETNEEALRWYIARGFQVEEGVVRGYYRRLNPDGARIVRMDLEWDDDIVQEGSKKMQHDPRYLKHTENSDAEKTIIDQRKQGNDEEEEDDDWEKLEADEDDPDDHGVLQLDDSQILGNRADDDSPTSTTSTTSIGKRKRNDD